MRLLVVDDELHIRSALTKALSLVGYDVDEAASGVEALMLLEHTSYDLMVLDMLMPGMEGTEVLQQARTIAPDLSIIILTGNATLESAIAAVKSAAVDYLLKPASIYEIIDAITKALQKRAAWSQKEYLADFLDEALSVDRVSEASPAMIQSSQQKKKHVVTAHPLRLDIPKRLVTLASNPARIIALSKGETAVLSSLMENPGQILSCQQLVQAAWGYEVDRMEAESVIRPYIFRLRSKLEPNPKKPCLIHTFRRRGYGFVPSKDQCDEE